MVKHGNLKSHLHAHNVISAKGFSLFVITSFTGKRNSWNNSIPP